MWGAAGRLAWTADNGLFNPRVETDAAAAALLHNKGDGVTCGGDSNDWFDAGGRLVWGATTGAAVTRRPDALLSVKAGVMPERAEIPVDRQV